MLELQWIGFLWAKSVSVFKNNDCQQIAKALMFEDPALEMFLPAIATCVLVHFIYAILILITLRVMRMKAH